MAQSHPTKVIGGVTITQVEEVGQRQQGVRRTRSGSVLNDTMTEEEEEEMRARVTI